MAYTKEISEKATQIKPRSRRKYGKFAPWAVLLLLILIYNIVFLPAVFEKILISQFEKHSNGKIKLHVVKSSLFRGFSFEKIEILSGSDFNFSPIVKIERLNLLYSVYGFFAGDLGFHEIGIYNPQIYLSHRGGVWNSATLMKKTGALDKPDEPKETLHDTKKAGLSLPFKIRGFIKFVVQNFSVTVSDLDAGGADTLEAGLKDFTLKTYIITKKFKYIPYSINATDIFQSIVVNLDPQKTIDVYYKNQSTRIKSPLDLHWHLTFDTNVKKEGFYSQLIAGHQNIPVEYKGRHLLPLNFGLDYNLKYNPVSEIINLEFLRLNFLTDTWINLAGEIHTASRLLNTTLNLQITKSNIDIGKVFPYFKALTNNENLAFRGNISLAPLSITGPLDNLLLNGKLSLENIFVETGGRIIDIRSLDLFYNATIDKNLEKPLVRYVKQANIRWSGVFNDALLGAKIDYQLDENIQLFAYIRQFNPEPFSSGMLSGLFDAEVRVKGKNEKNVSATIDLASNGFTYYVGRGISGLNQMNLSIESRILFPGKGFDSFEVNVPEISLLCKNGKHNKTIGLNASVNVIKESEKINLKFNLAEFSANLKNLKSALPEVFQEKIELYAEKLQKDIRLKGSTTIHQNGDQAEAENYTHLYIDDLDIDDVIFNARVLQNANDIRIPLMTLTGLNHALDAYVNGILTREYRNVEVEVKNSQNKIEQQLLWVPDLKYSFKLGKKEKTRIIQGQTIAGSLDLAGKAKGDLISGKLLVNNFYYDNGNFLRINNINLDFPFDHNLRFKKNLNLIAANKERLIKNSTGDLKFNFTIDSVEISNPTRLKEPLKIIYPGGGFSGLSAAMRYKDNVFEMPMMQIFMLNGLVSLQDTVFNVGSGDSTGMQYRMLIQIKDIDLKQLIPEEKAKSITDGKISADMLLSAASLKNFLSDTNGYVSIYKIGKQFAQQGVKIVMPDSSPLLNIIVDEWTIIHKFDFEIKEGLAYVKILYSKGFFGNIIGLDGNEIVQERRPIEELFQKAGEEVKIYQTGNLQSADNNNE